MILKLKKFFRSYKYPIYLNHYVKLVDKLDVLVVQQIKENQSLSGRIKILEEQHEIMHNFLVEINKYLAKLTDTNIKCDIADAKRNLECIDDLVLLSPAEKIEAKIRAAKKYNKALEGHPKC